jgi:hypothetical protein
MTTIAYRDGVLAADSQVTAESAAGGSRKHTCIKLFRKMVTVKRKTFDVIIATAGETSPGLVFIEWYGSGKPIPDVFLHIGGDFTCLVLTPKGLFEYDVYCQPEEIVLSPYPFYAVGSGTKAAMGAMHCGKSAIEAVRIACKVDPFSSGRIVSMKLEHPPAREKKREQKPKAK